MAIEKQLVAINPSVKDALFRRLIIEDDLGYLRKDNTIIGFEVMLDQNQELPGYAIIAIQKHTILAYRSDLGEPFKLILFPSMDKLEDPSFGLRDLKVKRKIYDSDQFIGRSVSQGLLKEVARDLIPPYKKVEVSDEMAAQMTQAMQETATETPAPEDDQTSKPASKRAPAATPDLPPDLPPDVPDDVPMDAPTEFGPETDLPPDMPENFDEDPFGTQLPPAEMQPETPPVEAKPKPAPEDARATELKAQKFTAIAEVSDYVILHFGINPDFASNVLTAALRSTPDEQMQIKVAVLLFVKLFNKHKV